jgi:hypothetical protein
MNVRNQLMELNKGMTEQQRLGLKEKREDVQYMQEQQKFMQAQSLPAYEEAVETYTRLARMAKTPEEISNAKYQAQMVRNKGIDELVDQNIMPKAEGEKRKNRSFDPDAARAYIGNIRKPETGVVGQIEEGRRALNLGNIEQSEYDQIKAKETGGKAESAEGKIEEDYSKGVFGKVGSKEAISRRDKALEKKDAIKIVVGMGSGKEGEKRGDLLAALAEKNVNLPAGMRSQQQIKATLDGLIKRNPDLSADEIAQKIKTGKLDMVVASSEARTAGTGLGKVEWAVQEMDKTAPLVLEASKAVPRGDFMPVNKLLKKWQEGGIQDPNQKELAIYVNSMMNAYDLLASRGGTDKDKRAEAHALLTSADSPEGLERGIKAFLKEGEVSASAAGEAVENITQSKKKDDKQSSKGSVSQPQLADYAKKHNISVDAAKKGLESLGYSIQ